MAMVSRSSARREAQWRARNPDLAARFDRLPAVARQNIRTAWAPGTNARGVSAIVRVADTTRRQVRQARDQRRREVERRVGEYLKLDPRTRSAHRPQAGEFFDESLENLFWRRYDKGITG